MKKSCNTWNNILWSQRLADHLCPSSLSQIPQPQTQAADAGTAWRVIRRVPAMSPGGKGWLYLFLFPSHGCRAAKSIAIYFHTT